MRKVQLTIRQEEVAPATTSDLVVMNNGKTLKEELSTNPLDQFSREVTVVNSMEKMVDGTCDGTYESLVFHGRSLVNVCPNGVIDYIATSDWDGYNGIGQASNTQGYSWKTLQDLKPNTKYFISCYVETFDCDENQYYLLNNRNDSTVFGESLYIRSTGLHKWVLTSKSEFTEDVHIALRCQNSRARGAIKIRDIMIIEYQEGMEEWGIPYFEGLCDSKMPILQNTGENLFDPNSPLPDNLNYFYNSDNKNQLTTHAQMLSCAIPVIKGKTYSFYFNHDEIPLKVHKSGVFPTFVSGGVGGNGYAHNVRTITAPMDGYFGIMFCYTEDGTTNNWTKVARDWKKQLKLTIVEGKSINTYVPYKTNILRTSEEIVLREVNGVQDTYNPLTGEYVRRISEVVFDGSSDEGWSVNKNIAGGKQFVYNASLGAKGGNATVISDKLPSIVDANESHVENIWIYNGTTIVIHKNLQDANELKTWLSQNPITVQYELAQPVTTIVEPSTIPFAYQNGHVIVESGFDGPSLLPELSYSVPVSKSGVISTASKTILNHEQRLHKLEGLLVRESILMDYRLTLSFLNNM